MKQWFLLRRQPVAERDHLLDLFSLEDGLIRVRQATPARLPDFLERCAGDWQSGRDWPKLRTAEPLQQFSFQGDTLLCALYLSELLLRLLPEREPQPAIFHLYQQTLEGLSDGQAPELWLRVFEQRLLQELGYGFRWDTTTDGAVVAGRYYRFNAGTGLTEAADGWPGEVLLAVAAGDFLAPGAMKAARLILRQALDSVLTRPLISRELLLPASVPQQ